MSYYNNPIYMIISMLYMIGLGIINLYYAFKTRNNPRKKESPRFFKNELLMGVLFFINAATYPFIYQFSALNSNVRDLMYFHGWISHTVHFIAWMVYCLIFVPYKNKKINWNITQDEWKEKITANFRDNVKSDQSRKILHVVPALIIIVFYIIGLVSDGFAQLFSWDGNSLGVFLQYTVCLHFALVANISNLLMLYKFNRLDRFALKFFSRSLKPEELETLSSANHMILTMLPFFALGSPQLIISVGLVGSISDAFASLIGKKIGKPLPDYIMSREEKIYVGVSLNKKKTFKGYIAGFISTFMIVLMVYLLIPIPGVSNYLLKVIILFAGGSGIVFVLLDAFAQVLTDNFYNPAWNGIWLLLCYLIIL